MPEINVVNEAVTQTPDIKKVNTPKPVTEPVTKPETLQKGIKVSDTIANEGIPNQKATSDQETTLDYEDAQIATSFEALNYNQSKSLADTWKLVSDDITERLPVQSEYAQGVNTGELLNFYSPKETSTLKNLAAGFVEAPAQTAKVIDSLLIWGGALTSKLGAKTLGERIMQFGAGNISNIDYMLKEYGFQDVNRESISYGVGGTVNDILTSLGGAGLLSKASVKYTKKAMAKESAELAAKESAGEVSKISLKKTLTSPEAFKLYQHAERLEKWSKRVPFAFMMGKDVGSMLLNREEQYMDKDKGFMETDKFMDNFWKETAAVGTYGTISSMIEAYFGLGPILKGVPKGSELTLQALKSAGKDLGWLPFAAKNHIGATFIGLSTLKEGITEALQEGTQSLTEMVFGLGTRQKDGTLVYIPKQFKQELQRILISGAIGGVVGGGMAFGHVQLAKSQFVELTENTYKETHKDYTEEDIKKVNKEAKETFNQVYGEVANTLSQELNTQQDIATMQGPEFVELYDFVHKQLLGMMEKGVNVLKIATKQGSMDYTAQVANAMSKLLISKGVPVSDFKEHLKLRIEDYNGVVGVTAFWDTTPLKTTQESGLETNSLGQPISDTKKGEEKFKEWFGDSTFVNEEGKPVVFFSDDESGLGVYGTESYHYRNSYVTNRSSGTSDKVVYLKGKKPLKFNDFPFTDVTNHMIDVFSKNLFSDKPSSKEESVFEKYIRLKGSLDDFAKAFGEYGLFNNQDIGLKDGKGNDIILTRDNLKDVWNNISKKDKEHVIQYVMKRNLNVDSLDTDKNKRLFWENFFSDNNAFNVVFSNFVREYAENGKYDSIVVDDFKNGVLVGETVNLYDDSFETVMEVEGKYAYPYELDQDASKGTLIPIFRPQELVINPNERYEEEKKLLSQYTKVTPKDAMYAELKAKLKGNGKGDIWIDNSTNDVVTEPSLISKLNLAQETVSLNKIPDIILKDAKEAAKADVLGAFSKSMGTIFIKPNLQYGLTVSHELGHMYAENMYMLYKSGRLSATEAKDFSTFLEALGIDTSLPHLTTKDSEHIADVFAIVGSEDEAAVGRLKTKFGYKEVENETKRFKEEAKKAFQTVNRKDITITPAVKEYVQDVLGIKPKDILATVDTKGVKEDIINNLPKDHEDYKDMTKAVQEDSVVNLDAEPATIVKDATLDTLVKAGDMEGITKVVKDNLNVNSKEGCVESLADNLNNIVMQRIQDISATTGKTVQEVIQEAKQDDLLFQKLLPTLEEIKAVKDLITKKDYGTLSLWDVLTSIRYGSMLGSVSTFTLSTASNTMNTAIARITDILTGRFSGVTNTVSEATMETVNKAHTERWNKAGLPNAYAAVTPAELAKKTAKKAATYKGKGEGVINLANKIGNWSSMVTTALPDHIAKTYYSNYVASMTASKIAMEKGLNANDIMLDSVLDNPLTKEGQEVRNAAQDAMRDVEFLPSGNGTTIGEKTVQFFNRGLDGALSVIEDEDVRNFVKSAILPFNGIASGIAARAINGMIGLPYEGIYGMVQAFKEGDVSVFIDHVKNMDRRYYIDSLAALIVAGALEGLFDDDDYMPSYDLATYAQRQAAKRLGIPFDSIRIGDVWVSTEYCGLLHTAVKLLPTLRKVRDGKLNEAWGEFSKSLASTALEAPVIGLGTDGVKNVVEGIKDPVTGLTNYLNSYVPRMITATSKVISQEDNYYNPLTGTNQTLQPYMQFIFGSRARLYTEEQAAALKVVSKGINVVPGVKKDMTEKEQQKYAKEYSKRYRKLIHSPALKRMDAEEIKNAFKSIKKQATKASGYKKKKKGE